MATRHIGNHIDFVELPAPSVEALGRAKTFLGEVFGWSFHDFGPDYADLTGAGLGAGLNADPQHRPAHPLVVVYATHLEVVRERVLKAGGTLTRDIFEFPGGRRFHFTDPAGNELAVWSDRAA